MQKILKANKIKVVEAKIRDFEDATGVELLVVVAKQSDPYPAASLRFGLLTGFILSIVFSTFYHFSSDWMWPVSFLLITIVMTWVGQFDWAKKITLSDWETQREAKEKAIELFHTLGTSAVSNKVTAIIMLSEMERIIEVLIDKTLKEKITDEELNQLVSIMQDHFKKGDKAGGLIQSIESLQTKIISDFGGKAAQGTASQLSDTIHFLYY